MHIKLRRLDSTDVSAVLSILFDKDIGGNQDNNLLNEL